MYKRFKFLLISLMFLTSVPVWAANDVLTSFTASLSNTKDVDAVIALTVAAVKASPDLAGKITIAAIEAFPGSAEKIIQAAIAASPSSANNIIKALIHDYEVNPENIDHTPGVVLVKSEANVNLTETVREVIIESLKSGLIDLNQATKYANDAFGPNSEAAKQIIIEECKVVSCN